MSEKMKAMVLYGPEDIRLESVPVPECGDRDVLLKIKAIGLCGSDIRTITYGHQKIKYPWIIGHEITGEVAQAGKDVTGYKTGDRLYVSPVVPCHHCRPCKLGFEGLCEQLNVIGTETQGDYAEYMLVTEKILNNGLVQHIPDHLSYEQAVLTEPLSSVYACQEDCNVTLGNTVVVIGLGPIGSLHTSLAKIRGASRVIAVEQSEGRLAKAKEFGADYLVNAAVEDPVKKIQEITDGWGAEIVISACPSTEAQKQAISMACKHGTVVFFGGVPKGRFTDIDTNIIHYNSLRVIGHYGYGNLQASRAFSLIVSGRLDAKKFVTHILPLEDLKKAIDLTKSGEAIKVVLRP
jgi:L-iditol 2-dehydrogenase